MPSVFNFQLNMQNNLSLMVLGYFLLGQAKNFSAASRVSVHVKKKIIYMKFAILIERVLNIGDRVYVDLSLNKFDQELLVWWSHMQDIDSQVPLILHYWNLDLSLSLSLPIYIYISEREREREKYTQENHQDLLMLCCLSHLVLRLINILNCWKVTKAKNDNNTTTKVLNFY